MSILPGIYYDISSEQYHRGDGISKSALDQFHRSPAHYHANYIDKELEEKESRVMIRGSICHCLALEPELFEQQFSVEPEIKEGTYQTLNNMREAIEKYNSALEPLISTDEIVSILSSYNSDLTPPLPLGVNVKETGYFYGQLPIDFQSIPSDSKKFTASAMRACIKEYNATLKTPVKTTGSRDSLLLQLSLIDPTSAERERNKPQPLTISGTKEQLAEKIRVFEPDAIFAHELYAEWEAMENDGRMKIKRSLYLECKSIIDGMRKHAQLNELLALPGHSEVSIYWYDETGFLCKCRPDRLIDLPNNRVIVVDLKFTVNSSPKALAKKAADMRYHVQDAHYTNGLTAVGKHVEAFIFAAIEPDPPFAITLYEFGEESKAQGHAEVREDISGLCRSMTEDLWPAYTTDVITLNLPYWALSGVKNDTAN